MFRNRFDLFARFAADGNPQGGEEPGTPSQSFQRLLQRHENDAAGLAAKLFDDNYQYRQRIRELEEQTRTLQGKVPADGAVVLHGEDTQAWETYRSLGTPAELQQGLEQRTQLADQLHAVERAQQLRDAAEQSGYKPTVLAQLERMAKAQGKDLAFEVKEVEENGQKTQVAFVKDGEAETPLSDYAAGEWADFLPALTAQAPAPTTATPPGVRYPVQHPGGRSQAGPKSVADEFMQEREKQAKAVKNPLLA